jgi:hypothetical protein
MQGITTNNRTAEFREWSQSASILKNGKPEPSVLSFWPVGHFLKNLKKLSFLWRHCVFDKGNRATCLDARYWMVLFCDWYVSIRFTGCLASEFKLWLSNVELHVQGR